MGVGLPFEITDGAGRREEAVAALRSTLTLSAPLGLVLAALAATTGPAVATALNPDAASAALQGRGLAVGRMDATRMEPGEFEPHFDDVPHVVGVEPERRQLAARQLDAALDPAVHLRHQAHDRKTRHALAAA